MAFRFPKEGTRAHTLMGSPADIAEILDPKNLTKLLTLPEAISAAKRTLQGSAMATKVSLVCLRPDDERWLISVGRRGGWSKVWNFGTGAEAAIESGPRVMSYENFVLSRKRCADIGEALSDAALIGVPGFLYCDVLFIESLGDGDNYRLLLGNEDFMGGLEDLQQGLYEFAVAEGYCDLKEGE